MQTMSIGLYFTTSLGREKIHFVQWHLFWKERLTKKKKMKISKMLVTKSEKWKAELFMNTL